MSPKLQGFEPCPHLKKMRLRTMSPWFFRSMSPFWFEPCRISRFSLHPKQAMHLNWTKLASYPLSLIERATITGDNNPAILIVPNHERTGTIYFTGPAKHTQGERSLHRAMLWLHCESAIDEGFLSSVRILASLEEKSRKSAFEINVQTVKCSLRWPLSLVHLNGEGTKCRFWNIC